VSFKILKSDIQSFINSSLDQSIFKLALQKNPFPEIEWSEIINQIACKNKAKTKLPDFFEAENIIYPSKISLEQTSSFKTAIYKSDIVSGESLIDMTGGFGVDSFYFSKKVNKVIHCEINLELSKIVVHNFKQLKTSNIECYEGDSIDYLKLNKQKFDWMYLDPSRRNLEKDKVFMLKDCLPNVPKLQGFYFEFTDNLLIKTAPILDISAGLSELKFVKTIHIVAVNNEVKELLWEIKKDFVGAIQIKTINFSNQIEHFDFELNKNEQISDFGLPKKYIFEPNSAIMKSGGFDEIGIKFELQKLHQNSHLYTSEIIKDFPGRVFEIENTIEYSKTDMKKNLANLKANITVRNFPETVDEIRKKWKIKDGGNRYCFFATDINDNKIVLICKKIKTQ
jgi:ubiquinone/menaquinone biosynthesis C-methylase UbiE/glutaredoxin-related protein